MAMNALSRTRRVFLQRSAAAIALPALGLPAWARDEPKSPFVKRVVMTPENTYFTYPHSNAFMPDGSCVIAKAADNSVQYLSFNFDTGASSPLFESPGARMYFAISGNGLMAFAKSGNVLVADVTKPDSKPKSIYSEAPWRFHADCDISPDGKTVLATATKAGKPDIYRLLRIDVASGQAETIAEAEWFIDHAHFSPFDPEWICYADGVPSDYKRMWVWNKQRAPKGRALFNQRQADGKVFDVGHERAMFNKPALLTIAYGGESSARPCGLYEVGFDGNSRLVSESMRDFHCNISRDGRFAVVSLQGEFEQVQKRADGDWSSKSGGYGLSDVVLVNMATGARQFLYRSYNSSAGQPYEVQPSISPNGQWVLMKNGRDQRVVGVELDQGKMKAFLGS